MKKEIITLKSVDKLFYKERLNSFLPEKIIDFHTHVWVVETPVTPEKTDKRVVSWPNMVASQNTIEDLVETYRILFPDKKVTPLIFPMVPEESKHEEYNQYVIKSAKEYNYPSLIFSDPKWCSEKFEQEVIKGNFLGAKSYLTLAPSYIPAGEIRIFDFFPKHQLEVLNKHGLIMMLHIPRNLRLKDPVNLGQILEIENDYPNIKLVVAHVGRAYCKEDVGNAFEVLKQTERIFFDISANTNDYIFEKLINTVGSKRILFGSDLPILRMRTKRICENGTYINIVPKGLYGDVSHDSHMREFDYPEADNLTFFLYEEIDAFRRAAERTGLTQNDIENVFFSNADKLISECTSKLYSKR